MSTSPSRDADDADVDRLLRAVLKPSAGGRTGECPDADTLAAFVEGRLSPHERSFIEAHLAGCGRCQEALAIVGLEPAIEQPAPARSRWFTWVTAPRPRWLVPVTAAATVAAVFFATRPIIAPGDGAPAADVPVQMARAEPRAQADASVNETASARPERQGPAREAAPKGEMTDEVRARPVAAPAGGGAAGEGKQAAAREMPTVEQAVPAGRLDEAAARGKTDVREVAVKEAAKPAAGAAAQAQGTVSAQPGLAKSAAPSEVAGAPRASIVAFHRPEATGGPDAAQPIVVTPDGSARWRLGAGGRVWRSDDGGVTWREQRTGAGAVLTAGSAPSRDVCWIVGEGGTVLLTVDGASWQRRPFPFQVDLAGVRAADARSAVITASDGRRFETRDGGFTWR